MSEDELNAMFESAEVVKRASQTPPLGIVDRDQDRAKGLWIAIQISCWLRNWKGRQYPRVVKITKWDDQQTNLDILVGQSSGFQLFKLVTNRAAKDLLVLKIAQKTENGPQTLDGSSFSDSVWVSYGIEMTDDDSDAMVIETLPKGERTGKKHAVRAH